MHTAKLVWKYFFRSDVMSSRLLHNSSDVMRNSEMPNMKFDFINSTVLYIYDECSSGNWRLPINAMS